jgi:hypothetical protein
LALVITRAGYAGRSLSAARFGNVPAELELSRGKYELFPRALIRAREQPARAEGPRGLSSAGTLDATTMNEFIGFNLFLSMAAFNISLIYMKYFLSTNGFKINWLWGWGREFSTVKQISNSLHNSLRGEARKVVYGIYFSVGYLIGAGVFGVIFSK